DHVVQPRNSENLAQRLRARGEKVELRVIPGIGHFSMVRGFHSPEASPALAETLRFIGAPVVARDDDTTNASESPR
ncbi:MAG: hypothetical protein ACREO3_09155, partial [Arenimonas sp.]